MIALLAVTVLWGWTFVWMKQAIDATKAVLGPSGVVAGVGLFMSLRFGAAAALMLAIPAVRRELSAGAWRGGVWIGLALLGGFLLQMFGLEGVSPAVSAFLTSLYVLFTALLTSIRARKPPHAAHIVGALLATFGAGFIGGPPQLTFGLAEWLTIGCAFVFSVHILVTDTWTKREKPLPVTFATFAVVAVGGAATLAAGVFVGDGVTWSALDELLRHPDFWRPLVLASLLATVLALTLMNMFQRELDPVRAAIVYALEPVWAAMVAIAMGLDRSSGWLYLGGGALLAGNLVAELVPLYLARQRAAVSGSS